MGLMALLIILFHAEWTTNTCVYDGIINRFGSIGVDVFVFVSGFGLAHALTESDSFESYIGRRFARILPAYYIFEIINLTAALCFTAFGIKNDLFQPVESWIVPIGVWLNYDSHKWYIAGTLGFYVIAAVLFPAMRKSRYLYLTAFLLLLISVGFIPYIADMNNMPLAIERIPALVIGLTVGTASLRKERKYKKTAAGLLCLSLLCLLGVSMYFLQGRLPGAYWNKLTDESNIYVRQALTAPMLAVVLAFLLELSERIRLGAVRKGLAWTGQLSLELYLIHTFVSGILEITALPKSVQVLLTVALSYPAAMLLKRLSEKALTLWRKASTVLTAEDSLQ